MVGIDGFIDAVHVRVVAMLVDQALAAGQLAQQDVEHRHQQQAKQGHAQHAGENRHADGLAHFRTGAVRRHHRQHAHDESDRRHQNRTQTHAARFDRRFDDAASLHLQFTREFHDQDRVLGRQADQHHQADLREDVVVAAGQPHADQRRQDADRDNQDDRQRQRQAFVLRGQHQEHQQHADGEHPQRGIAGQRLLVSQVGPFHLDPARQRLRGDAFDGRLRLVRRIAGGRAAVDVGGGVAVVAHHHFRAEGRRHFDQRRQRHHLAAGVARLQRADIVGEGAELRVRLHPHLIHAAEAVEVIRIGRTEIDLHRIEDVGHRHAQLLGLDVQFDRVKAKQLGVSVTDVFDTMQVYLGSAYANDFNRFGRVYQVRVQADAQFRSFADDIGTLKTRNASGEMVPLSSLVKVTPTFGPEMVVRYNGYTAADINGGPAPGYSSDQAQAAIERIAAQTLPRGIKMEWTDLTYQQTLAGNAALWVFPISVLLVFLVLAAQYESLTLPLAIILIVPVSILAALVGVWLTGGDNNIFTQIGLMVLVGLSAKNAILIVEFARELEMQGRGIVEAAIEASRMRLRPILMTSIAFIMGVLPMVTSSGAGSEMRKAIGVAVFSGMLGVTLFGLLLVPVFYVLLRKLAGGKRLIDKHGHNPHMHGVDEAVDADHTVNV